MAAGHVAAAFHKHCIKLSGSSTRLGRRYDGREGD
jgi:hypothetical protein